MKAVSPGERNTDDRSVPHARDTRTAGAAHPSPTDVDRHALDVSAPVRRALLAQRRATGRACTGRRRTRSGTLVGTIRRSTSPRLGSACATVAYRSGFRLCGAAPREPHRHRAMSGRGLQTASKEKNVNNPAEHPSNVTPGTPVPDADLRVVASYPDYKQASAPSTTCPIPAFR